MAKTEKTYHAGPVRITKHVVPWSDGGWDQFEEITVRKIIDTPLERGLHYFNPAYTLFAEGDTDPALFMKQVRRALVLWQKQINRVLGPGARRRAIKRVEPSRRPYIFTGIAVINGKQVHPKTWHKLPTATNEE